MFVDSDDWVSPDYVKSHYDAAVRTNADIVIADYYQTDGQTHTPMCLMGRRLPEDTEFLKKKYLECGGAVWSSIYKRYIFEDNNLYFPENIFYEDNALMPSVFLSAKSIVKIDEYLYYYRQQPQSTTRIKDVRFYHRLDTAIMCIENTKRLGLYEKYEEDLKKVFFKLFFSNSICGIYERRMPHDKISYITSMVKEYLTPQELKTFINRSSRGGKIVLRATLILPMLGYTAFRLIQLIGRMRH